MHTNSQPAGDRLDTPDQAAPNTGPTRIVLRLPDGNWFYAIRGGKRGSDRVIRAPNIKLATTFSTPADAERVRRKLVKLGLDPVPEQVRIRLGDTGQRA